MAQTHVDDLNVALATYGELLKQAPTLATPAPSVGPGPTSTASADSGGLDKNGLPIPDPPQPPPPAPAPPPPVTTKPIIRPNGQVYIPRTIKALEMTDVAFVEKAYSSRMPILLYGPPGTGKTALFEASLPGLVTLMGTSETEVADFVGTWVQRTDGLYEWVDGPLAIAAEGGLPFLVDEIALVDSRTMAVVYALMDGRDELPVTANPARGSIKVKEGFVVVGACNPDVPGAIMSDALLSRFKVHVNVMTDWNLAKRLGVGTKIITVAKNLDVKYKNSECVAPPQLRELLTFQQTSDLYGEVVALRNFLAQSRPEDRVLYSNAIASVFGQTIDPLTF